MMVQQKASDPQYDKEDRQPLFELQLHCQKRGDGFLTHHFLLDIRSPLIDSQKATADF